MTDRDAPKGNAGSDAASDNASANPNAPALTSGQSPVQSALNSDNSRAEAEDAPTVFDTLGRLVAAPGETWRSLKALLESEETVQEAVESGKRPASQAPILTTRYAAPKTSVSLRQVLTLDRLQLSIFGLAFAFALRGTSTLLGAEGIARTPENTLDRGAPFLVLAFLVWLLAELIGHHHDARERWKLMDAVERARWIARIVPILVGLTAADAISASMIASPEHSLAHLQEALVTTLGRGSHLVPDRVCCLANSGHTR